MLRIPRKRYADLFGPTVGDRVRLADTDLIVGIEKDLLVYGDELVFGGGKSTRDGMGQTSGVTSRNALDLVITNTIVMDPVLGIIKADIGIKNGLIAGVGKAGNPNVMDGVDMIVGSGTEVISGEHTICTPGTIDTHIHFISPQQAIEAICSGTTTSRHALSTPPSQIKCGHGAAHVCAARTPFIHICKAVNCRLHSNAIEACSNDG